MPKAFLDKILPPSSLRAVAPSGSPRVTNMELFFDLVYVFSIVQLSHFLLAHESWTGALQAATLFAAIWWAWNYTAWATNWLDPDRGAGRALMIVLMGCALTMAVAAPEAFSERAGLFVGAYVAMALIRAFGMAAAFRGQQMGRNYLQLGLWGVISGAVWIAGALFEEHRLTLWLIAVAIDYAAPYLGYWLPGLGKTPMDSWPLRGLHLLERNQQVFIIALGESILLLGALLAEQPLRADVVLAAAIGFLTIVALWWIYFVRLAEHGEQAFVHAQDHARLARAGLAYAHGIMVCGAIVVAVSIEMIVAHPTAAVHAPVAIAAAAGPILFLAGSALFHRATARRTPVEYLIACAALAAWAGLALALHLNGLALAAGALIALGALAARCRE